MAHSKLQIFNHLQYFGKLIFEQYMNKHSMAIPPPPTHTHIPWLEPLTQGQ